MEIQRKEPKRISFDLGIELHKDIKMRAAFREISLKEWVIMAILQRIEEEKKYE